MGEAGREGGREGRRGTRVKGSALKFPIARLPRVAVPVLVQRGTVNP